MVTGGAYGDNELASYSQRRLNALEKANPEKARFDRFWEECKKPDNYEPLVEFLDVTNQDYTTNLLDDKSLSAENQVVKFLNQHGFMIVPDDDPLQGEYGFSIHNAFSNSEYRALRVSRKIYSVETVHIHYNELQKFVDAFNEAVAANYMIIRADQPKKLLVGFIVLKMDSPTLYEIKLSELRPIWQPTSDKEILTPVSEPADEKEKEADGYVGDVIEYGYNSKHEKDWGGILEFNIPGTEYQAPVESYRDEQNKKYEKRYKIRWMKYVTKKRDAADVRYYTAEEFLIAMNMEELKKTSGDDYPLRRASTIEDRPDCRKPEVIETTTKNDELYPAKTTRKVIVHGP